VRIFRATIVEFQSQEGGRKEGDSRILTFALIIDPLAARSFRHVEQILKVFGHYAGSAYGSMNAVCSKIHRGLFEAPGFRTAGNVELASAR
jgi:hypothetical protein